MRIGASDAADSVVSLLEGEGFIVFPGIWSGRRLCRFSLFVEES